LIYLVNDVLHHCLRKGPDTLLKTLEQVVVHMFSNTSLSATDEEQNAKLQKLVVLWQTKNNLFERGVLERLHAPLHIWNEYHNSLVAKYSAAVAASTSNIQHTYENYRGQHQAFVNHANHQIQQLEQQKLQIEEQIAAANALQSFNAPHHAMPPDFLSRPPPVASLNAPQNYPCEGIEPKAPYFDLPAGLLVPLVRMEDSEYKSIDPKDIRLPAPLPPSERLIAAIDFFYSPLSHDRPRNADGFVIDFLSCWLIIQASSSQLFSFLFFLLGGSRWLFLSFIRTRQLRKRRKKKILLRDYATCRRLELLSKLSRIIPLKEVVRMESEVPCVEDSAVSRPRKSIEKNRGKLDHDPDRLEIQQDVAEVDLIQSRPAELHALVLLHLVVRNQDLIRPS
jgi:hypothetical protein